jgi:uncharacterized protein YjbI with pentapeptide repeats
MSLSSKVNYSLEALSGITVGNINITGNIFQNNNPYIASQWTSTSGNALSYTSGNVIISNGSLLVSALTTGNINFTGTLYQNGAPYVGSQWTTTTGNLLTYTSGNVLISNGTISASGATAGILYANNSRIGINTTSPLLDLDLLNGAFGIRSNSSHDHLYFTVNGSASSMRAGGADGGLYIDINGSVSSGTYGSLSYTRVATFTSRGNVGIGNTSPSFNLDVTGTGNITTSLTTGALYSTNLTTTNIVGTSITASNINVSGTLTVVNITSTNLIDTNISAGTLVGTSVSVASLSASSSTLANSFISGGLGIGTTNPNTSYNLDVAGSIRSGLRLDIGGNQPIYSGNTLGRLFITGAQNSVTSGPNILITTSQDSFPTYNFLTYGHDSSWTMYDMYFDGSSFRNSGTSTAFAMLKDGSTLKWNYNSSGFSAGAAAPMSTSICIGSGGNVGLGGQVTPVYTLDVSGGARIISGITAGSSTFTTVSAGDSQFSNLSTGNINFTGSLFQNGSAYIGSQWVGTSGSIYYGTAGSSTVGINTTAPGTTLDVSGTGRITTSLTSGALYSTNLTTTNVVGTRISAGNFVGTTISTTNMYGSTGTISNFVGTNLSGSTLNISSTGRITTSLTTGALYSTNQTTTNIVATNISSSTLNISSPTNATSVSNGGALTVVGGAAVGGDLIVGGSILYSNAAAASSTFAYLTLTASDWSTDIANGSLVVYGGISVQNTANAVSATEGNGLTIAGGAGIGADLYVGGTGYLPNIVSTNSTTTNLVSSSISASNINVSGTLTVVNITSTNLVDTTISVSTLVGTTTSTANVYGSLGTISNMVHTNLSSGTLVATTTSTANVYGSLGTISNLVGTNLSSSNLRSTVATIPNIIHTNITTTSIIVTGGSLNATFNSNTIGSIFTTGGNVGIGTTSPNLALDVFTTTTSGHLGMRLANSGNHIYFMHNGGTAFMRAGGADFGLGFEVGGLSSGTYGGQTYNRIMTLLSTGNVGINTTTPAFTLDVDGTIDASTYITSGALYSTNQTTTNIVGTNTTITNLNATTSTISTLLNTDTISTNISSGTITATTYTGGIVSVTSITTGTIRVTGNADLSTGLTTVTDLTGTNITSGTIRASTLISTSNLSTNIITAGTSRITTSLVAIGNSNTLGNIFTTNGNVGIGTTSPSSLLHLFSNSNTRINIDAPSSANSGFSLRSGGVEKSVIWRPSNTDDFAIWMSGTNSNTLYIKNTNGNIGIGTTNPSFTLDVNGTIDASTYVTTGALYSTNQTTTNIVATASTITNLSIPGTLTVVNITSTNLVETNITAATIIVTGGSLNATFNSNTMGNIFTTGGNVGINTSAPVFALDVNGNFRVAVTSSTTSNTSTIHYVGNSYGSTAIRLQGHFNGTTQIGTDGLTGRSYLQYYNDLVINRTTQGMTTASVYIDSANGNVGLNTTDPSHKLDVNGTARIINSFNATFNSNTIGSIFTTGGNVGISTATPSAPLHITRNVGAGSVNPLVTLTALTGTDIGAALGGGSVNLEVGESGGNVTTYNAGKIIWGSIDSLYGPVGEYNGLIIIQTANNRTLGNLLTLTGNQRVGINTTNPGFDLDVNGTIDAITYTGANLAITSATAGTMIANDTLSIGGISSFFTGSFSANNNVASASNVTGLLFPSASVRSFVATLNINVSKAGGNLNEMVTLEGVQGDSGWSLFDTSLGEDTGLVFTIDSTGQVQYTSINHISWTSTTIRFEGHYYTLAGTYIPTALPTTGNVSITGDLSISSTKDATNTSSGALTVLGGAGVSKSLLVGQNLNVGGVSNTFTGSFAAANNVAAATNVTGFLVPTATFSSFTASVNVRLLTTTTTLNAQYLFEATQTTSGWLLNDTTLGDSVGLTFTITSTGQIQYTSTNVANWQSTTINYSVTAISISTGFTAVLPTSGSVTISGNLTIDSTTDSSSTSSASLVLAGGAGINKSLLVGGNFNIGGVTTQFAGTFSAANGVSGATFTGLSFPNATIRSFSCTISIRVVSNTNYNTQHTIDGIQTATGGWQISDSQIGDSSGITFAINSSGQITYTSPTFTTWTSTTMHYNAVAYNISSSYTPIPMPTGGSSSVAGSLVIQGTDEASSTSSGSLSVSGGVNVQKNLIVANNFFVTSAGNVGISTSSPQRSLHVAGQWIRLSSSSGSSYGEFFVDSSAMTILGKNSGSLILRSQGNWVDEGVFIQNSNGSVLLSALQSGNVGIATTAPAYTLDVNGTFEASNENGLILFASSGNVGIGTTAPSSRLTISSAAAQLAMYPTTNGSEASIAFFNNTVTSGNTTRWVVGNNAAVGVGNFGFWNSSLGAPVMGLTSTGNVGIGTTAPNSKLHVIGNINTTIGTYIGSGITTADTTGLHIPINNALVFMTNATERIRITGGNVGIGTSTPSYTLDINGSLRTTGPGGAGTNGSAFITGGDSYGHSLYIASSSGTQKRMGFNHNGTVGNIWAYDYGTLAVQNLILQYPGGNVGIGTAPGYKLEVLQDNTGAYPGDTTTGQIIISGATDSTKRFGFQLDTVRNFGHIQVVRAGDTAYPLILNGQGGNVGIGTTSPTVTLDVAGTIRAVNGTTSSVIINGDSTYGAMEMFGSNGAYIDFKNNSGDDYDSRIQFTGSNNSLNFYMSTGNTVGMSLTSAGTLLISGDIGAFASISDARLKTNVENITPDTALNTVKTLRPVTFNWRDDIFNQAHRGEFDSGFIAQEVEEVIPHAVGEYTTIDYQNTYKNMRHERIIPYLVGSIQKLEGIITELRDRIEYLESR